MKKERLLSVISALLITANLCGCTDVKRRELHAEVLVNHMTQTERDSVQIGRLTLLDSEKNGGNNVVNIQWWSKEDYIKDFEENYETYKTYLTSEELENSKNELDKMDENFMDINKISVNGREYNGFFPPYDYKGGKLEYNFGIYTTDGDGTVSEKAKECECENFDEFKKWYNNYLDERVENNEITESDAKQEYEDMQTVFQSVIDGTWEEFEENTGTGLTAELAELCPGSRSIWEYERGEVEEIFDSVKEMTVYDEELDSNFVIHITLPPDYDVEKTYPVFVMTDGVWRFGNCPSLWKLMRDGEAQNVILVTIGYDYSVDGTQLKVRGKYLYEERVKLLDFLTDNLMPYLSENYHIDFGHSGLYGHSAGGVFSHNAAFISDKYENQPFKYYIIGSPAFWELYRLDTEKDPEAYKSEYGYFERNDSFDKVLYVCGGENEDPDYEEYYGDNDSTLDGISHFIERMNKHGVKTAECKIYKDSNHYEFIPEMFIDFFKKYYSIRSVTIRG